MAFIGELVVFSCCKRLLEEVPLLVEETIIFAHTLLFYVVLILAMMPIILLISYKTIRHYRPTQAENIFQWLCNLFSSMEKGLDEVLSRMEFSPVILIRQVAFLATMMLCAGLFRITTLTSWCLVAFLLTKLSTAMRLHHLSRPGNIIAQMAALTVLLIHLSHFLPGEELLVGLLYIMVTCVSCQQFALSFFHWPSLRWIARLNKYSPVSFLTAMELVMWLAMGNLVHGMLVLAMIVSVNFIFIQVIVLHPTHPPIRRATYVQLRRLGDEVCPICLCNMQEASITACDHYFHTACLYLYLEDNDTCPVCDATIYHLEEW